MDSQRSFLVIALAIVSFFLWQEWQKDYGPQPAVATQQVSSTVSGSANNGSSASMLMDSPDTPAVANSTPNIDQNRRIKVSTDVFELEIDSRGGDIVSVKLPEHNLTKDSNTPYVLMRQLPGFEYVAQSGLIARDGPDRTERPLYQVEKTQYQAQGTEPLVVPLRLTHNGMQIEKRFTFTPGQYDVRVEYFIVNNSDEIKTVQPYQHLLQNIDSGESASMFMPIYRGAAFGSGEERYKKYNFEDMQKTNLSVSTQAGWVAMLEHYFVAAWIPDSAATNQLYSRIHGTNKGVIGALGTAIDIDPGQSASITATFYAGPKVQDELAKLANGLDLTVDYGFLWFISQLLFWLLTKIQLFVSNWGLAIICITLIVKGAMFPLTKIQYESMAKMRNLKPKIEELQARYKDDKQKMGPAMMELYRKEKVNPMGGCLPMLIQMPIFLALYWVFVESIELRHAPFMLWITDLSTKDPYYVLPVLFGLSMFMMQKLTPMQVTDPLQQKLMMWMPVAFSVFFFWFPSGLVLYWLVSNLISLGQMLYIYRGMEKKGLHTRKT
ncbi:membrane protein insertase YidC [Alishewanella sp. 16-MA]|uniref:Membrane protein insertase YidC n=2 Tax=Gammaproteobacteria TaxID=1236 RepID=A0ABS8C2P1_9ALTE|nr:membrane protein insertase YidC [Alishewanella maricola]MCB5226586.1 membrane protein insertase YidC [Alishewanella maricola]MDP4944108.1 membrane protein insertase YidC [Alishewanella sp.]